MEKVSEYQLACNHCSVPDKQCHVTSCFRLLHFPAMIDHTLDCARMHHFSLKLLWSECFHQGDGKRNEEARVNVNVPFLPFSGFWALWLLSGSSYVCFQVQIRQHRKCQRGASGNARSWRL